MITQSFDLNMIPSSAPVVVHVDQYDHGEGRFIISLYNGDTPYTPTGTAIIQGTKPDGKGFEYSATLSGNTVTANLTEQMTAVYGIVRAQIVITETSGRTGTFVFNLDVQKSALPADADMSRSEYQLVEELLEDVQQAAADAAQSAEDADASAEDSEAWAIGTRDGVPVTSDDPTYHNNSKWWAEHGGGGGGSAHTIVNAKGQDMTNRAALKFANMKVTDDATHNQTIVESGSIITITTTESTLYGKNVTLSDGTTTLTETFSNSGVAVFYGVSLTGNLSISSSDGVDTAIGSITVPYFGIFEKDISFWSATIAVSTTTSDFDGLTVYAKKNGVTKGSAVFSSGSANITVPETGSYTLEVTQDWHTYTSQAVTVSAQTTYNASIDGFKAPISLSTPTTDFYGQNIAVSLDGNPITTSLAFDNTGSASFDALVAGTYVFTLTYQGEPYTATVVVTTETSYSGVIKMWTATIKVTASSQLYSQSVTVYKGSTSVGTVTLDATGKADILVHEAGTYYVKGVYDGWTYSTDAISVSAETDYPVTLDVFICTLSISTTSTELYSQTITVTKGGSTVGTTAFSAGGSATFRVHETGTYTLTCTYSGDDYFSDITIVSGDNGQTKTISIETGLKLSDWLTEAGLNPASYADFAAVEADEAAVRKLMTIHDAVDYLATASAGDELMEDVINSDICAKWINLRDYALDTLYANSDIAAEMDTADKYFYGEWCIIDDTTTPVTWGAKGNVPVMTSDTTPYGQAIAAGYTNNEYPFHLFNENWDVSENCWYHAALPTWAGYKFLNPVCVKKFKIKQELATPQLFTKYKLQGSNVEDFSVLEYESAEQTVTNPSVGDVYIHEVENTKYCLYWRVYFSGAVSNAVSAQGLQFYGREMKVSVPIMTGYTTPCGVVSEKDNSNAYYGWKAFDGVSDSSQTRNLWEYHFDSIPGAYIQYKFNHKIKIGILRTQNLYDGSESYVSKFELYGSNDGFVNDIHDLGEYSISSGNLKWTTFDINIPETYQAYRITIKEAYANNAFKNNGIYAVFSELQFFGFDYTEYEWDADNPRLFIYDHGVELRTSQIVTTGTGIVTKKSDSILVDEGATSGGNSGSNFALIGFSSIDVSDYNYYRLRVGRILNSNDSYCGNINVRATIPAGLNDAGRIASFDIPKPLLSLSNTVVGISNVNQAVYTCVECAYTPNRKIEIEELWLE